MLALAEFAVAIRPKPTLLASAPERVVQAALAQRASTAAAKSSGHGDSKRSFFPVIG